MRLRRAARRATERGAHLTRLDRGDGGGRHPEGLAGGALGDLQRGRRLAALSVSLSAIVSPPTAAGVKAG